MKKYIKQIVSFIDLFIQPVIRFKADTAINIMNRWRFKYIRTIVTAVFVIMAIDGFADGRLKIDGKIQLMPFDLTVASHNIPKDNNGNPCAVVKVIFPKPGATFEGNVKGQVYRTSEYWVYLTVGSKKMKMKHAEYGNLEIHFDDSTVGPVKSKQVYEVKVTIEERFPVVFTIIPSNVRITVDKNTADKKMIDVTDGEAKLELATGEHTFVVEAKNYEPIDGIFKVSENSSNRLDVNLKTRIVITPETEVLYGEIYIKGSRYIGYHIDGLPHRKGTYFWKNGNEYDGHFYLGKRSGEGTMTWVSGDKYEGDWVNDKMTGKGKYTWSNGEQYEGDFVEDLATGKGTYTWKSGNKYIGDFIKDKRTGKGIYIWLDGDRYEGSFIEGKKSGYGIMIWSNGDRYEGNYVNDKRDGKGTMTWSSGDRYEGDFVNDKRVGNGIMTWSNGDRYEGSFVDGKLGNGILYRANGKIEKIGY